MIADILAGVASAIVTLVVGGLATGRCASVGSPRR